MSFCTPLTILNAFKTLSYCLFWETFINKKYILKNPSINCKDQSFNFTDVSANRFQVQLIKKPKHSDSVKRENLTNTCAKKKRIDIFVCCRFYVKTVFPLSFFYFIVRMAGLHHIKSKCQKEHICCCVFCTGVWFDARMSSHDFTFQSVCKTGAREGENGKHWRSFAQTQNSSCRQNNDSKS